MTQIHRRLVHTGLHNCNHADFEVDPLSSRRRSEPIPAVQVKRRIAMDTEPVDGVRNLVGAMVLSGSDCGIFVTTASLFSAAAQTVPGMAKDAKKLELNLVDGERLF